MNIERPARHILTIDLEEHFHASRFDSPMRRRHWSGFQSRIQENADRLLNLLAHSGTKATFFVLGWLAERHPALIQTIAASGHEIACLGYSHQLVAAQTPDLFRHDIRRGKFLLEDLIGHPVPGFRAASFGITSDTDWALPIVAEEGFIYDSSILQTGLLCGNEGLRKLDLKHQSLWEISPSTFNMMGFRVPIGGGGYLRALSYPVLQTLLSQIDGLGEPIVLYLRAWELDAAQPRMRGSALAEFRHYLNLDKMESRLQQLVTDFAFGPAWDALQRIRARTLCSAIDDGLCDRTQTSDSFSPAG